MPDNAYSSGGPGYWSAAPATGVNAAANSPRARNSPWRSVSLGFPRIAHPSSFSYVVMS